MKKHEQLRFPDEKSKLSCQGERCCKNSVYIEVNDDFKEALKMVLDELNAIYRFEDGRLVMYESEFKHFVGFMKPVIEFCDTLRQTGKEAEDGNGKG